MAYTLTYSELLTLIPAWVTRETDTQLASNLPALIMLGEMSLAKDLKTKGVLEYINNPPTDPLIAGQYILPKPTRWLATKSFEIGIGTGGNTSKFLEIRTYEALRRTSPDATVLNVPAYYADFDYYNWVIAPSSDATYNYRIGMISQLPLLDTSNQTNWATQFVPQCLIYAILLQVYEFLGDLQQVQAYTGIYNDSIQKVIAENTLRLTDGYITAGMI